MSKTRFPHPSAPTIAKNSASKSIQKPHKSPPLMGASSRKTLLQRTALPSSPTLVAKRKHAKPRHTTLHQQTQQDTGSNGFLEDAGDDGDQFGLTAVTPQTMAGGSRDEWRSAGVATAFWPQGADTDNDAGSDFPRGGVDGPRPVYCICRRGMLTGEPMLRCVDCRELFHGSCVAVPAQKIRTPAAPLYVCDACVQQHPRKKRVPGTILGVGSRVAPLPHTPKKSKKKRAGSTADAGADGDVAEDEDVIYLRPAAASGPRSDPASLEHTPAAAFAADPRATALLPAANQRALAAFMSAAAGETMDDDDICPICEDECTCFNIRAAANTPVNASLSENDDEYDAISGHGSSARLMPLFLQKSPSPEAAKKQSAKKTAGSQSKPKTKAKPRAKKGKGSKKSLISELVDFEDRRPLSLLDRRACAASGAESDENDEGMEYELFDPSSLSAFPAAGLTLSSSEDDDYAGDAAFSSLISRPKKAASATVAVAASSTKNSKKGSNKNKNAASSRFAEPFVYEVKAEVIQGRERRPSADWRGLSPVRPPSETLSGDDEFINITDVTSDTSAEYPSETEFDLPSARSDDQGSIPAVWSDTNSNTNLLDGEDGDEDIERAEEEYLLQMEENGLSSSSLSDFDDERLAGIRRDTGITVIGELDSGNESDSESDQIEGSPGMRAMRQHRRRRRHNNAFLEAASGFSDSDAESLSDIGSIGSLSTNGDESETDQELTFREAQTEEERALVAYAESCDEREEALLSMHLDQLRAVRNIIQDCSSSPILDQADSGSDVVSDLEIEFTYRSDNSSESENDSDDLSDDLMEGWTADTRRRWEENAESDSDSMLSESKIERLRLKGDEDDNHSDLYSSDSYDEFYTRSAFLDMGSDDEEALEDALYPSTLDLDSASLALGVALSMEQQGYSKEDAAAAAAVAAAAYPGAGASGEGGADESGNDGGVLGKQIGTTTITASMNANGEADPIDGIVSIKSSTGVGGASRMASGTHTPFFPSEWRAAAAAAAAYLDNKPVGQAVSYVLPKDLNEARSPSIALAVNAAAAVEAEVEAEADAIFAAVTESTQAEQMQYSEQQQVAGAGGLDTDVETNVDGILGFPSATSTANTISDDTETPGSSISPMPKSAGHQRLQSAFLPSTFTSQLPNSAFYKPLTSICSPIRRASSSTAAVPATRSSLDTSTSSASGFLPGMPMISLAEVNAALSVFADQSGAPGSSPPAATTTADAASVSETYMDIGSHKRKASECSVGEDVNAFANVNVDDMLDNKRARYTETDADAGADTDAELTTRSRAGTESADMLAGFGGEGMNQLPLDLSMLLAGDGSTMSLGAGTPMRSNTAGSGDGDDWLLAMDQLVDTDALLIKSPPPSPVDLFSRWDRIPVNIFRRSRALASSRGRDLTPQNDVLGSASSLALTAIKSSRQRRALINTTLLAQHTLPAEAALQQHAMKMAMRGGVRRGVRHPDPSSMLTQFATFAPPPPPPTPLSAEFHSAAPIQRADSQSTESAAKATATSASASAASVAAAMGSASGATVSMATSDAHASEEILSVDMSGLVGHTDAADDGYAFGWLEDSEDLALFAMPELSSATGNENHMHRVLLASASPMLAPFRPTGGNRSDAASANSYHHQI
ncbi:hypothetical protein GGI07_000602 [Coemansia sp. Benny D115]|nr:hypothetical protein GGI07_000602 [Coemansia sp. Benny D115]